MQTGQNHSTTLQCQGADSTRNQIRGLKLIGQGKKTIYFNWKSESKTKSIPGLYGGG